MKVVIRPSEIVFNFSLLRLCGIVSKFFHLRTLSVRLWPSIFASAVSVTPSWFIHSITVMGPYYALNAYLVKCFLRTLCAAAIPLGQSQVKPQISRQFCTQSRPI